jgi:hypothetical protein
MNPSQTLFPYGIQTERSDLRAHVCPVVHRVYVFPTQSGVRALSKGTERLGHQASIAQATANGHCVRPFDIERCVALEFNSRAWKAIGFSESDDTSAKGKKAVLLIKKMLKAGLFPLPVASIVDDGLSESVEIKGADVYAWIGKQRVRIQVKCDYRGGEESLGGTGYLYLQTAERNPLRRR